MTNVKLTVKQFMNLGLWSEVCKYKGWSEYIVSEGRISVDELVEYDPNYEKQLNTLKLSNRFKEDLEIEVDNKGTLEITIASNHEQTWYTVEGNDLNEIIEFLQNVKERGLV